MALVPTRLGSNNNSLAQTLTLSLDLGHRVRTKWDEGGNKPKSGNKPKFMFLGYNSPGLHFQNSRVGILLNDSGVKNGWDTYVL